MEVDLATRIWRRMDLERAKISLTREKEAQEKRARHGHGGGEMGQTYSWNQIQIGTRST